jgi:hypothetical protein
MYRLQQYAYASCVVIVGVGVTVWVMDASQIRAALYKVNHTHRFDIGFKAVGPCPYGEANSHY